MNFLVLWMSSQKIIKRTLDNNEAGESGGSIKLYFEIYFAGKQ